MIAAAFTALIFLAALGTGIAAGLFFIFSNTIMASFARLPAAQGIAAMQQINVTIINPLFMLVFMGLVVLSLVLGAKAIFGWAEAGSAWLLAGSVAYLVGCFLVTMVFNVPLNDALAAVDPASAEGAAICSLSQRVAAVEPCPYGRLRGVTGVVRHGFPCRMNKKAGVDPAFQSQAWRFQRATACSISFPTRSG